MALSDCNTTIDAKGRELAEHGTAFFPFACYHDDLTKDMVIWHWHDEIEALVVTEGSAIVAAGNEKYTVAAGNGFFINAGVLHAAWNAVPDAVCRFHSIVFHPRLVGGSMDSIFWQKYLQPLLSDTSFVGLFLNRSSKGSETAWLTQALEAIETSWQLCTDEPSGFEFSIRDALSHLVFLLFSNHQIADTPPSAKMLRDSERIKIMLQYIQENYAGELTTTDIAASAAISSSECLRCFHTALGITPIQYVRQFRIQKAAELLQHTDLKITDIGALCGFQEMSYFARAFRDAKGVTPSEYRSQL